MSKPVFNQASHQRRLPLRYLIERAGPVVSRELLLLGVWAYGITPKTRTVDMRIAALRQKLERDPGNPELIVTVHSQGYRFNG
ncbi:MAG TPA: helix-turn-helix domain-containing protein [Terriglobia bacterium]|nr:helix-turn-helix domain-containing protein [Terriglobia bacterium]